jgi:ribosomal protein L11 methyltransferase
LFSLLFRGAPADDELLVAELYECGTSGIQALDDGLRAFFDPSHDASTLLARFAAFQPELRIEPETDWEQQTRDAWPPLCIGQRLYLVAPWNTEPAPDGRIRLEIEPGMACGTGRHPATQLCLEALEGLVRPGMLVADIGTGSGILGHAALVLGARCVVGCDVDSDTVSIAAARLPGHVFTGSAEALRSGSADLLVSNIDAAVLEALAPEFERIRKPGAPLILSGFREDDLPRGFLAGRALGREGWTCWILGARST